MAKRRMKMAGSMNHSNNICMCGHCSRSSVVLFGIIAILVGLAVWNEQFLTLPQAVSIMLILGGIKKFFWCK